MQSDRGTEWPTHPDTSIKVCHDVGNKGQRCGGRLEEMKVVEHDTERDCVWCLHGHPEVADMVSGLREWTMVVGWSGSHVNRSKA